MPPMKRIVKWRMHRNQAELGHFLWKIAKDVFEAGLYVAMGVTLFVITGRVKQSSWEGQLRKFFIDLMDEIGDLMNWEIPIFGFAPFKWGGRTVHFFKDILNEKDDDLIHYKELKMTQRILIAVIMPSTLKAFVEGIKGALALAKP